MFDGKSNEGFLASLENKKLLTLANAHLILETLAHEKVGLVRTILDLGLLAEDVLADNLATYLRIKKFIQKSGPQSALPLDQVNTRFLRQHSVLPIEQSSSGMKLAMLDPLDCATLKMMVSATQQAVIPCVATRSQLNALFDQFLPDEGASDQNPTSFAAAGISTDRFRNRTEDTPAVRLVDRIMDGAVLARASDIHLDLSASVLEVRYRIDGILKKQSLPNVEDPRAVIARIKVMAEMDIAEKRLPQDGRARIVSGGREIDLRLASLPVLEGESITIRLLNKAGAPLDLSSLGFSSHNLQQFRKLLAYPNGLILVTGPTGSGKTTTLYAALQEKIDGQTKIMSIEDPVEFNLSGVTQISINSSIGLTFPNVLRATLRHDPDIILIGEIRDKETAEIAIRAALTGHLVLATLHTNTAVGAVSRLLDMGIADYLITAAVRGTVSQRLVRRRTDKKQTLEQYTGRCAISEVLMVSAAVRKLILAGADNEAIENAARTDGMKTIIEDAQEKIHAGTTTEEELLRVSFGINSTERYA